MKRSFFSFREHLFSLLLAASGKSKDIVVPVKIAAFTSQYLVMDLSETYTLQIESMGGRNFQIKEFGGFWNVPLNAVIDGTSLKIPAQTFTNPSRKSIAISGTSVLSIRVKKDGTIKFDYKVTGWRQ